MLLAEKLEQLAEQTGGELPLPAGNAPGALNERSAEAVFELVSDVMDSPAALANAGSICTIGNDGNAVKFADPETGALARDHYFDKETGDMANSIGLKQPGKEAMTPVLRELRKIADDKGKVLKVSVSTLGDEDASIVLPNLAEWAIESGAHAVEVNLGCPNKVESSGLRHPVLGRDVEATGIALAAVGQRLGDGLIWGPKLSWYDPEEIEGIVDYHLLKDILAVVAAANPDFVTLSNTELNVDLRLPDGSPALDKIPGQVGGGSGPARANRAYEQLKVAVDVLPWSIDVISANGVWDGAEVRRRELAGAVLSEAVSRLWVTAENEEITYGQVLTRMYHEYIAARESEAA